MKILYEDSGCLVVDKPSGILVYPRQGEMNFKGTVVGSFLKKIKVNEFIDFGVGIDFRPGVVHRLDKDTSGVLLLAKNKSAYNDLVDQFKSRTIEKNYLALVRGILQYKEAVIDSPIGRSLGDRKKMALSSESLGKKAVSQYRVVREYKNSGLPIVSLIGVSIKTGRTHQIRVHMAAIGHPVVGDDTYGDKKLNTLFKGKFGLERQFLHAEMIRFKSSAMRKLQTVKSGLPDDLRMILDKLEERS